MPSPAGTAYAPFQAAGYFVCPDAAQLAWARLWQSENGKPGIPGRARRRPVGAPALEYRIGDLAADTRAPTLRVALLLARYI